MHMEQVMLSSLANSGKEEQHVFYIWDPLEVISAQMRTPRNDQIFTIPRLWNDYDSKAMYKTRVSRTHTMDALLSKTVFQCVRKYVMTSTKPLTVWYVDKDAGIASFIGMV